MTQVGEEFLGGLIDLGDLVGERDPDQWLEEARLKLRFRSHSSLHKAVAEATSLKYDCVHKALSGRKKAKRIQAEIKYCLDQWLADAAAGREPEIADAHRGVPVEQMHGLLERLEQKFRTKEQIYRAIAGKTGLKTGSVRRYFQSNGQLKYAPLDVYDWAERLAQEDGQPCVRQSYLADSRTKRAAERLAERAREALTRWRSCEDDGELEMAFRELRRTLIVTIKEGQRAGALMRA
jgi:hypothetical protein